MSFCRFLAFFVLKMFFLVKMVCVRAKVELLFLGVFQPKKRAGAGDRPEGTRPKKNGIWFEKNPQKLIFCGSKYFCGVAGSRTRVQTSNQKTFYTLIFCLGFRCLVWTETTAKHLSFLMSTQPQSMAEFRFIFTIRLYRPL